MKQKIITSIKRLTDAVEYVHRKNGTNTDLMESLPKSKPISNEQRKEILDFWKPYLKTRRQKYPFDVRWFDVFNKSNVFGYELKYYIPNGYHFCIIENFLTDVEKAKILDDKNLYDLYFYDVNRPRTICRKVCGVYQDAGYNIITEGDAVARCVSNQNAVIKPAVGAMAGSGIVFWRKGKDAESSLKDELCKRDNYVVQDTIKQHAVMASLNESSVNTMRLVTLLWKGEVVLTTAVAIMGGGEFKNQPSAWRRLDLRHRTRRAVEAICF